MRRVLGTSDLAGAGLDRTLRGLRTGDQRDLFLGLGLVAAAFLRRTAPRKRLVYSKAVPEGSAIVIHHRAHGDPRIKVVRPK